MAGSVQQTEFELKLQKRFSDLEKELNTLLINEKDGIYNALVELDKFAKKNMKKKSYDVSKLQKDMWQETSKQWADALSKQMTTLFAKELTKILSDIKYSTNDFVGY